MYYLFIYSMKLNDLSHYVFSPDDDIEHRNVLTSKLCCHCLSKESGRECSDFM